MQSRYRHDVAKIAESQQKVGLAVKKNLIINIVEKKWVVKFF